MNRRTNAARSTSPHPAASRSTSPRPAPAQARTQSPRPAPRAPAPAPAAVAAPAPATNDATNVVIVGGGPVALVTALQLLEYGRRRNVDFMITIYERRWILAEDGLVRWCGSAEYNNRRWQVVTIQSNVWSQLPPDVQATLFPDVMDPNADQPPFVEMWPFGPDSPVDIGSPRNIPVRVVEDKLLDLLQQEPYYNNVQLCIGSASKDEGDFDNANFVILANGGGAIPGIPDFGESVPFAEDPEMQLSETVLGIFVQNPEGGDAIGISESEGMALTVSQNRFLLNPLGRQMGFLNMWLSYDEAQQTVGIAPSQDGTQQVVTCSQGRPCMMFSQNDGESFECQTHQGTTFLPAQMKGSLWDGIQDGLKLYGIDQSNVKAFTTFTLGPFSKRTNFFVPLSGSMRATNRREPMVFVVGDAAIRVSFRAGRGLNTGIKGATSLARSITAAAEQGSWRCADFVAHSSLMFALQEREVRIRSLAMMSYTAPGDTETTDTSVVGRIAAGQTRLPCRGGRRVDTDGGARQRMLDRLERIGANAFAPDRLPTGIAPPNMDVLRQQINEASDSLIRVLDSSLEWNTREVGGLEIAVDNFVAEPQAEAVAPRAAAPRAAAPRAPAPAPSRAPAPAPRARPAPRVNAAARPAPRAARPAPRTTSPRPAPRANVAAARNTVLV